MWIHLVVKDNTGAVIYESGRLDPGVDPEESTDTMVNCEPPTNPLLPSPCASFYDRTYKSDNTPAHFFWEVASYKSFLIRPAITRDPNAVGFDHSTKVRYAVGNAIYSATDRVEATLLVRPLPYGMMRELEQSGDLDPSVRAALQAQESADPIIAGRTSVWTKATAGTGPAEFTNCNPQ